MKSELSRSREENYKLNKEQREELSTIVKNFGDTISSRIGEIATAQKNQFEGFSTQIQNLTKSNEDRLDKLTSANDQNLKNFQQETDNAYKEFKEELKNILTDIRNTAEKINSNVDGKLKNLQEQLIQNSKESRDELSKSLKSFEEQSSNDTKELNLGIKEKFDEQLKEQKELNGTIELKLDKIRSTVEEKLKSLQEDNSKKLDEMRATVDEKLQSTLEKRLGESFKLVSDRLEQVHKGLGEMQSLATGVGDLKKVLSNVKARGILGEYQLENLLEQLLSPDQYAKNKKTKEGSNTIVEFAVKLPGRADKDKAVWLPIDSKFPTEDYQALMNAYETGDLTKIDEWSKVLANNIKSLAKDIRDKYIDPPNTTDFAIMFLPFEGLYAEVLRNVGLFESIQREFRVTITGPTTLAAFLSSLQMGFRTLAIEKRSSEVWEILGAVKTEFGNFGEILKRTHKKLQEASNVIDQAGVRSRAIERKLRDVQELPKDSAIKLLGEELNQASDDDNIEEI
ncbi:MAG: DNA recombination protein RmuC [Ignavibacterium album]|nr:DNA recombination protein RmuC [Ignavibacterium album]